MRDEIGKFISEIIKEDNKVHFISLDVGQFLLDKLKEDCPKNIWNFGVSEQAAIGIASGMALEGLRPYVYSITPFILERPFEQIKLDIVEQKANVKLIGFWDYPEAGPTHITKEPKEICRILNIPFFAPKSSEEARRVFLETYSIKGPAFISLTRDKTK